jgi:hypothetical protein
MMEGEDGTPLEAVGHFVPVEDDAVLMEYRHAGKIESVSGDFKIGVLVSFDTELGREGIDAVDGMIAEVQNMLAFIAAAPLVAQREGVGEPPVSQEMMFIPGQDGKSARYAAEQQEAHPAPPVS